MSKDNTEESVKTRQSFFPITKIVRCAPLHDHTIQYMLERYPDRFFNESDYVRKAITLQARSMLPQTEFEMVMSKALQDMPVELRDVR